MAKLMSAGHVWLAQLNDVRMFYYYPDSPPSPDSDVDLIINRETDEATIVSDRFDSILYLT